MTKDYVRGFNHAKNFMAEFLEREKGLSKQEVEETIKEFDKWMENY